MQNELEPLPHRERKITKVRNEPTAASITRADCYYHCFSLFADRDPRRFQQAANVQRLRRIDPGIFCGTGRSHRHRLPARTADEFCWSSMPRIGMGVFQ